MSLTLVCISDTHTHHAQLVIPEGDVLIHAGDITSRGEIESVEDFSRWLGKLPHKYKVVIAGNHDFCFERNNDEARSLLSDFIYLQDESCEIESVKFYGSPWQPWFCDWAFNLRRGAEIRAMWDIIPKDTDVLITHGPPLGHGDHMVHGEDVGCEDLLEVVEQIGPKVHIFGHIHEGYGITDNGKTKFVNASSCDVTYQIANEPLVIEV